MTDYFANEKPLPEVVDTPADKKVGKHFDISEFVCYCCGRGADKIDPRRIELPEELRSKAGVPISGGEAR